MARRRNDIQTTLGAWALAFAKAIKMALRIRGTGLTSQVLSRWEKIARNITQENGCGPAVQYDSLPGNLVCVLAACDTLSCDDR